MKYGMLLKAHPEFFQELYKLSNEGIIKSTHIYKKAPFSTSEIRSLTRRFVSNGIIVVDKRESRYVNYRIPGDVINRIRQNPEWGINLDISHNH